MSAKPLSDLRRSPSSPPRMEAPGGLPTRADIEEWSSSVKDLSNAAAEYRQCANDLDAVADAHCQALSSPGGTEWTGDGADGARQAGYVDRGVVWQATDHIRKNLAKAADDGAQNVNAARNRVQDAIDLAEQDGFKVGDDLSVADTKTYTELSQYNARLAKATEHSQDVAKLAAALVAEDAQAGMKLSTEANALDAMVPENWGMKGQLPGETPAPNFEAVDFNEDEPLPGPGPAMAGQPTIPPNRFIGDQRFGHWEPVTESDPAPSKNEYRPLRVGDDPTQLGGTTGMYTPGKNWIQDSSAPYLQYQEEYRFRIAGQEATTYTQTINDNGVLKQERWVQNVYEYQENTRFVPGGDIRANGKDGSLGGLPPVTIYDHDWKQISPQEVVSLSADNSTVKYYLPDGCGGQFTVENGVPVGGYSGLPPVSTTPTPSTGEVPPVMTRPH